MTTNETLFFRDQKPFNHLRGSELPRLLASRPPGRALRIWSAAASTGQEAYSIAMLLDDCRTQIAGRPVEIVATDIAREPLNSGAGGAVLAVRSAARLAGADAGQVLQEGG